MGAIVIVLLEDSDRDAERILAALSEGGPECRVHRARDRRGLAATLARRRVDLILAAGAPAATDARAVLDLAHAACPAVPVVVVARDPEEEEAELLGAGAAGYVPGYRLEQLGETVQRALDTAAIGPDRGRAEAALRFLTEAGDELLARAAHELRTPLNAMLGWASMLRTRRLDEAARTRALETIERNARAEARLIDDLLDVSRMLTGTLRLEILGVELCPLVAAAVEVARPAAEAQGLMLSAVLDEATGPVAADPGRIRQVIQELLVNAVRATPRGGLVGVKLGRVGPFAEIAVRDTGRGIGADRLPRIFSGLSTPAGPHHGGLGVGLSIARHLIEAHGGAIVAESEGEGQGATFTVRLPLAAPP